MAQMLMLVSFVLLVLGTVDAQTDKTCGSHTCGTGAHCINRDGRPVCACLPDYTEDALSVCVKKCVDNSTCSAPETCRNQRCVDPCFDVCAKNSNCVVENGVPRCTCLERYTGNPYVFCMPIDHEITYNI